MFDDTIVAISTPFGESGIGIIRMSGEDSLIIADKIFRRSDNKGIFDLNDHTINYGWIIDPKSNERVDEVLVSIMKGPRTYTKENIVEINCHGGRIALNHTMDVIVNLGARIALPGEFTKRAFINGRIDLTQAEAVLDIIRSKTDTGLCSAVKRLMGDIRNKIEDIKEKLIVLMNYINAGIDFSEEVQIRKDREKELLDEIICDIENIIKNNDKKRCIEEGLKIVICGKTNVGKSSLINAIYGEKRILTSRIAGTTRDSVQIDIYFEGMIYHFVDTAGLREGKTKIEKLSIKNSKKEIINSDCLIMVFDISRKLTARDIKIIEWITKLNKEIMWIVNKSDLKARLDLMGLKKLVNQDEIITVSAKDGTGIERILKELKNKKQNISDEIVKGLFVNKRQRNHLISVEKSLFKIKELFEDGLGEEIISEELKYSIKELENIIGKGIERVEIEKIFNQFCIGK